MKLIYGTSRIRLGALFFAPVCLLCLFIAEAHSAEDPAKEANQDSQAIATVEGKDKPVIEAAIENKTEQEKDKASNQDALSSSNYETPDKGDKPKKATAKDADKADAKKIDDPILAACAKAKPGEEVVVEGMTVTCKDDQSEQKVFDFQAASPVEEPSLGFVGFSDKYLNDIYLTLSAGYANYASMVSYADLDRIKTDFEAAGYTDTTATGSQHGAGISVGLGYIANKYILVELGYSYLGATGISGTASDDVNTFDYTFSGTMSSLDLSTIARYRLNDLVLMPITNIINIMAVVEAHQWSRQTTGTYLDVNDTGNSSGFGFSLGFGADFEVNKFVTVRSTWEYKTIANEGISALMISAVMKNNTLYAQAIQDKIVNPITNLWK